MNGYEINVAKKDSRGMWRHLFATDTRSLHTERDAKELYELFQEKFPESEGYTIMVTYWHSIGEHVEF